MSNLVDFASKRKQSTEKIEQRAENKTQQDELSLEQIMEVNKQKKKREEQQRKQDNQGVIRSYRLK